MKRTNKQSSVEAFGLVVSILMEKALLRMRMMSFSQPTLVEKKKWHPLHNRDSKKFINTTEIYKYCQYTNVR